MRYTKKLGAYEITMDVSNIGNDLMMSIYGGDVAHIGAVALAFWSPLVHEQERMTTTVMNLTVPGHKEDELTRLIALDLARKTNKTVVVTMGIHIDGISHNEIAHVTEITWALVNDYLESI